VSPLSSDRFGPGWKVLPGIRCFRSTHTEMHFLYSLVWEGFWSTYFEIHFMSMLECEEFVQQSLLPKKGLVNSNIDTCCVLGGMGSVWSTQVDMHYLFSLALEGYVQHMFGCIFCLLWHGKCLVNTNWDKYFVLAGSEWVWSTHFEINSISSWPCEEFGQHMLRCIYLLAGMGLVWTTQVETFLSSLAWKRFGQHKLSYILCSRWHGIG
jgi:hypothetical protein